MENRALAGRSSRTFFTEGLWEKVFEDIGPGDYVLMQFGHNDGGGLNDPKGRASLKGTGEETQEVTKEGKQEIVHTYGWYLRRYIRDAKGKGAIPIVLSPIPRNMWQGEKVNRASRDYGKWARESAEAQGALFVDLNEIVAKRYEAEGRTKVQKNYFDPADHTHTKADGARVNAECVVAGLRELKGCALAHYLRPQTKATKVASGAPGGGPMIFVAKRADGPSVHICETAAALVLANGQWSPGSTKRPRSEPLGLRPAC